MLPINYEAAMSIGGLVVQSGVKPSLITLIAHYLLGILCLFLVLVVEIDYSDNGYY
jgi:hypothetical protein